MSTYIDTPPSFRWNKGRPVEYGGFYWRAHTFDRLAWQYGHERARAILAGTDPKTNADLAAWNRLGKREAA